MSFANAMKRNRESIAAGRERRIGDGDVFGRGYFTDIRQRNFPARRSAGRDCRIISSELDLHNRLAASGIAAARISLQLARGASLAINTR